MDRHNKLILQLSFLACLLGIAALCGATYIAVTTNQKKSDRGCDAALQVRDASIRVLQIAASGRGSATPEAKAFYRKATNELETVNC